MKQLLKDMLHFITGFNQMDLLLYFAVLILIILVVSLIYIIKTSDEEEEYTNPEEGTTLYNEEDVDLKEIITNIEESTPPVVEYTDYEKEQEEKAIISYDELLERSKMGMIKYDTEEANNKEVSIKKINLDKLAKAENKEEKSKCSLFHYEKEEAFLKALQSLNELLN